MTAELSICASAPGFQNSTAMRSGRRFYVTRHHGRACLHSGTRSNVFCIKARSHCQLFLTAISIETREFERHRGFLATIRKLHPEVRAAAREAYRKFSSNPAHPSLHLERLRSDPRFWSVRVTLQYRAVALRRGDDSVWFWVGSHEEFDRQFRH